VLHEAAAEQRADQRFEHHVRSEDCFAPAVNGIGRSAAEVVIVGAAARLAASEDGGQLRSFSSQYRFN
jgi:hypothetical protein